MKAFMKMLGTLIFLSVVGCATLAHAVAINPPSPVPALSPTVITVKCSEDSFVVIIGVVDGALYLPEIKDVSAGEFTFTGPPGTYAIMGQENGKRFQQSIVIVGSPFPDPDPDPDPYPDPDPDPIPEPGLRAITVIYESEQATPEFALAARSLQVYSNNNKHLFRLIDNDAKLPNGEAPEWLKEYISLAHKANVGDPFMVVTARSSDDKATVVALVPFPVEKDKAIELLKKFGG